MRARRASQKKREEDTTAVLLKGFPSAVHREMKAEAARQDCLVAEMYAVACTRFLRENRRRKGGEDS